MLDGRWVNRDPIAEAGEINIYLMALNNLLLFCDKWGTARVKKDFTPPQNIVPTFVSHEIMMKFGSDAYGKVEYDATVECDCECLCDNTKKTVYKPKCTITIKPKILIDKSREHNIQRGLYGHEQRHIRATFNEVEKVVVADLEKKLNGMKTYTNEEECNRAAGDKEIFPRSKLNADILNKRGGADIHGKKGHPVNYVLYEPLLDSAWGDIDEYNDTYPQVPDPFKWNCAKER